MNFDISPSQGYRKWRCWDFKMFHTKWIETRPTLLYHVTNNDVNELTGPESVTMVTTQTDRPTDHEGAALSVLKYPTPF